MIAIMDPMLRVLLGQLLKGINIMHQKMRKINRKLTLKCQLLTEVQTNLKGKSDWSSSAYSNEGKR